MTDHTHLMHLIKKLCNGAETMERHEWTQLLEFFPELERIVNMHDELVTAVGGMIDEYCSECDYGYVADGHYICSQHVGGCADMKPHIQTAIKASPAKPEEPNDNIPDVANQEMA